MRSCADRCHVVMNSQDPKVDLKWKLLGCPACGGCVELELEA